MTDYFELIVFKVTLRFVDQQHWETQLKLVVGSPITPAPRGSKGLRADVADDVYMCVCERDASCSLHPCLVSQNKKAWFWYRRCKWKWRETSPV